MGRKITDKFITSFIELGGFLLDFAKVNRVTYLDTHNTRESDTDHTVMLAIMACSTAASLHPTYDLGKIAQYSLVHDLVEVYSGDVNTINFNTLDQKAKDKAERAALQKIKAKFGTQFHWIHETIEAYEKLADPEARFVKTLDKVMPAITHHHSDNRVVNEHFDDPEAFVASVDARNAHLESTFASDQQTAMQIRKAVLKDIVDKKYKFHAKEKHQ